MNIPPLFNLLHHPLRDQSLQPTGRMLLISFFIELSWTHTSCSACQLPRNILCCCTAAPVFTHRPLSNSSGYSCSSELLCFPFFYCISDKSSPMDLNVNLRSSDQLFSLLENIEPLELEK